VKSRWLVVVVMLCCSPIQGAKLAEDAKVSTAIRLLEAWIESDLLYKANPGLSIGIVHDQELIWSRGFGYADVEKKVPTNHRDGLSHGVQHEDVYRDRTDAIA